MTRNFKLSRGIARLRATAFATLILGFVGCNSTDSLSPESSIPPTAADPDSEAGVVPVDDPSLASVSFAGGIPIGTTALPTSLLGARFNGAQRNIWPDAVLSTLAAIKSKGGKVILTFSGAYQYYLDSDGHFSLTKWKQRVDRYRRVNFSSYIKDGTIVGHYLVDEPNDPTNWGGRPVSPSTVDEMARYSKSIWPNLVTIARAEPSYFPSNMRYLDAAWAQYLARRGDVHDYIRRNVSDALSRGLALVVGLNVIRGGTPNGTKMTASEVQSWGSALLSSSYPCAFISWEYNADYLSTSSIKSAMDVLRDKAENRSTRSCRGS